MGAKRDALVSTVATSTLWRIGLLTVDVTPLGVVIAGDSQPVDVCAQHNAIHTQGMKERDPIVRAYARDFTGFAGFVGTEEIGGFPTAEWLARALDSRHALTLAEVCDCHPQIALLDTLERYAAYVKFRFEFTKRMYDPKYGIGVDPHPPVFGTIHVYSVDPAGVPRDHFKHVGQSRVIA